MRIRSLRFICSIVTLISLAVFFAGCAQRMQSVKDDGMIDAVAPAALQAIKVSEDGYQVTISSSKPLTYTFYKLLSPLKVILDISQVEPGAITDPIESATGNVKRVAVYRQGSGRNVLSRIEISLANDTEFTVTTDAEDKGKLLVTFAKPQSEQAEQKATPVLEATQAIDGNTSPQAPAEAGNGQKPGTTETVTEVKQPKAEEPLATAEDKKGGPSVAGGTNGAAPQQTKTLTAVKVVSDGVEIVAPGGVDSFTSFKLNKPARLVVDIPGVKNAITAKTVELKSFGIEKARLGTSAGKVRIVFDANQGNLPPYRIEKSENGLKLLLQGVSSTEPAKAATKTAVVPVSQITVEAAPVKHAISKVDSIDFTSEGGYSQITVKVSGACVSGKPVKFADGWGLTIKNCQLPLNLQRMLDTRGFASAIRDITPYQVKNRGGYTTKLLVKARFDVPYNFRQEGGAIYWSFKNPETVVVPEPPKKQTVPVVVSVQKVKKYIPSDKGPAVEKQAPANPPAVGKKVYTGRKVTLEFSDADVRKIFQLIAEVSGYNFLIADDVSGVISLKLVNVPWDQALDVILDSKNLEMKRDNNIVQIKPKGKFRTQEEDDALVERERQKRMPMVTKVFEISFAAVADIASKFEKLSSKSIGTEASVISDTRTNRVIVVDNEIRIKKMEDLLAKLDTPEKQVLIEARIVEASSNFTRNLGVQWGIHYKDASGSIMGINQLDSGFGGILTQAPPAGMQPIDSAGGSLGLSFGKLTSGVSLDMRLAAAATAGMVKIISTPKVVTLNNKPAKISQGQSIPYQTTSAEGTKTMFVEATLMLDVTPHISADGSIGMKITATNNSAAPAPAGVAPSINVKTATTELQVMNGETTVIGGIYVDTDSESDSGVPYLMDIPLLGWMFKSNSKTKTKTELLIFITPRVVN